MNDNEMLTSEVSARIGIVITAQLLRDIGFTPVRLDKRAVIWNANEYHKMCEALAKHISAKKLVDRPVDTGERTSKKKTTAPVTTNTGSIDEDDEEL